MTGFAQWDLSMVSIPCAEGFCNDWMGYLQSCIELETYSCKLFILD